MGSRTLVLISGKEVIDPVGGHESYVRAHALAATRAGYEPHVFEVARTAGIVQTSWGVVHRIRMPHRHPSPIALQAPILARAVTRFVLEHPDTRVVHSFGIAAAAGALAARQLARRGIVVVPVASAYATRLYEVSAAHDGSVQHYPLMHRVRGWLWVQWVRWVDDGVERRGYLCSARVLINYDSVRRILADAYGPNPRVQLVPYASAEAFENGQSAAAAPLELGSGDAPLILSVSRHSARKGQDVLLLALARLAADGIPFRACLAGIGNTLEANRRLATDLGLNGQVVFPGRIPDTAPYLSAADIFVLPSHAEASGSVSVIEALGAGKAVIASACDGLPEDLTHEHDALLFPPGDAGALAAALRRLLEDQALRDRLATNARATHERRFSADGFVAALAGVYDSLLADPSPADAIR